MRLLLDTQAAYLWVVDPPRLPPAVEAALDDGRHQVTLSAASCWEIAIKYGKGKLEWPNDGFDALLGARFRQLGISHAHGIAAGALPHHHGDPFDRILIAQAQAEGLTLVGGDAIFARYDVDVLWDG